jgi:hypothetical protein
MTHRRGPAIRSSPIDPSAQHWTAVRPVEGSDSAGSVEAEDWVYDSRSSAVKAVADEVQDLDRVHMRFAVVQDSPHVRMSSADMVRDWPFGHTDSDSGSDMFEPAERHMIAVVEAPTSSRWQWKDHTRTAVTSGVAAVAAAVVAAVFDSAGRTAAAAVSVEAAASTMEIVAAEVEMGIAGTAAGEVAHIAARFAGKVVAEPADVDGAVDRSSAVEGTAEV